MMDLMHLIEIRSVKQAMSPIKEEVLYEVDNQDLNEHLAKVWKIVKTNSYPSYVCDENRDGIDDKLIQEQILNKLSC